MPSRAIRASGSKSTPQPPGGEHSAWHWSTTQPFAAFARAIASGYICSQTARQAASVGVVPDLAKSVVNVARTCSGMQLGALNEHGIPANVVVVVGRDFVDWDEPLPLHPAATMTAQPNASTPHDLIRAATSA